MEEMGNAQLMEEVASLSTYAWACAGHGHDTMDSEEGLRLLGSRVKDGI